MLNLSRASELAVAKKKNYKDTLEAQLKNCGMNMSYWDYITPDIYWDYITPDCAAWHSQISTVSAKLQQQKIDQVIRRRAVRKAKAQLSPSDEQLSQFSCPSVTDNSLHG